LAPAEVDKAHAILAEQLGKGAELEHAISAALQPLAESTEKELAATQSSLDEQLRPLAEVAGHEGKVSAGNLGTLLAKSPRAWAEQVPPISLRSPRNSRHSPDSSQKTPA